MAFNISRQPLVPAFLLLVTLAIATVCRSGISDGAGSVVGGRFAVSAAEFPLGMPASWAAEFHAAHPEWSAVIVGLMILLAGMVLGRIAIRYNLHAVSTCLAMSLFGIIVCGLPSGGNPLAAFVGAALLALSIKNYARAFCNGYGFDRIFRAAAYQGLLFVLAPATAPLLLLLPLAVVIFQRTLREAIVGLLGLVLPLLLFCYVNWGAGGSFTAPMLSLFGEITSGRFFGLFGQTSIPTLLSLGILLLLDLFAVMLFLSDLYNVGTKPRLILVFNIGALLLIAAMICSPAASPDHFALLAIPSALLLPVLFVRIHRQLALAIYLLLIVGAIYGGLLQ